MTQRRQRTTAGVTPNRSTSTTVTATPAKISGCRASHPILGDQFGGSLVFPRVFLFAFDSRAQVSPVDTAEPGHAASCPASAAPLDQALLRRVGRRAETSPIEQVEQRYLPYLLRSQAPSRDSTQAGDFKLARPITGPAIGVDSPEPGQIEISPRAHRRHRPGSIGFNCPWGRRTACATETVCCLMLRLGPRTIQGTQPHVPVCDLTGPSSGCCQQPNLPSASVRIRAASYARGVLQNRRHSTTRQCAAPHSHAQWSAVPPTPSAQ